MSRSCTASTEVVNTFEKYDWSNWQHLQRLQFSLFHKQKNTRGVTYKSKQECPKSPTRRRALRTQKLSSRTSAQAQLGSPEHAQVWASSNKCKNQDRTYTVRSRIT